MSHSGLFEQPADESADVRRDTATKTVSFRDLEWLDYAGLTEEEIEYVNHELRRFWETCQLWAEFRVRVGRQDADDAKFLVRSQADFRAFLFWLKNLSEDPTITLAPNRIDELLEQGEEKLKDSMAAFHEQEQEVVEPDVYEDDPF